MNKSIPSDSRVQVTGSAKFWRLIPVENPNDANALRQLNMIISPGVGTWIPFLPRQLKLKLAAIDVVETIQELVHHLGAPDWPFPDAEVKCRINSGMIYLWFETPAQQSKLELPPLSASLFDAKPTAGR